MSRRLIIRIVIIAAVAALLIWILFFGFPNASASAGDVTTPTSQGVPLAEQIARLVPTTTTSTSTTTLPTTTTVKPVIRKAVPVRGSAGTVIRGCSAKNLICGHNWDATELRVAIHGCESVSYLVSNASGHRGGYQYADATWNNYGTTVDGVMTRYMRASDAPPWVQDQRAGEDIGRGAGQIWSNWAASYHCWKYVIH